MFFAVSVLLFCYCGLSYAATRDVGSAGTYTTIQNGYNAAGNGDTIQVQAGTYTENDNFGTNKSVALLGGYSSSFSPDSSYSIIAGTLTISNGTVTVENIIINSATLASIAVTPVNPSITLGTTQQFTATETFSENSTPDMTTLVTWSSSKPFVATISNATGSNGLASSVAAGNTLITARSGSITGSTTLTVSPPTLVSITVTPANSSITLGNTEQFTATGTYSDGTTPNITSSVTWSSSNVSVATISNAAGSNGKASSVSDGATTITATSGSIAGSTGLTVTGTADNVLSFTVNGSTCNSSSSPFTPYTNEPCVSVTVCSPTNTSNCVTINGILLDTGSFGLRIFKTALGSVSGSLTQVTSGSGFLAECVHFGDGSSDWGPVQMANVTLGNEPAVTVPVQVIDSAFGTVPRSCGTPDQRPKDAGFNGILGVGPLVQDCGSTCETSIIGDYYTCSGSQCSGTTVAVSNQVSNPVFSLPIDNNGLIVQLPTVAASGATSVTGSLVFGIGTQSNNSPSPSVSAYTFTAEDELDNLDEFNTTFSSASYNSFFDTGSNFLFFPQPTSGTYKGDLPLCSGNSGFFCPTTTNSNPDGITNLSATITGLSGSPSNPISFQIGNFTALTSSPSIMVFSDIGASSPDFDWGLPFYFGRNVFVGVEGTTSSLGTGPYFAY